MKAAPLILIVLGLGLTILFGLAAMITIILMATSGGRISEEEASPFIGCGCCCSFLGLPMMIGGLIWWLIARQGNPPSIPPGPPTPMPPAR